MPPGKLVNQKNRRRAEAESRLGAVLEVAAALFLQRGYSHTSLNDVIARAGGSKATLLKYFGSKAGLFAAVIESVSERFVATAHFTDLQGSPEEVLIAFGTIVLRFYLAHDSLVAYRGVSSEGYRYPSMAKAFYQQGHALVAAALALRLESWRAARQITSIDCTDDANLFLHLLRAGVYEQVLLGVRQSATSAEIRHRVEQAVKIFLHGIKVRS